MSGMKGLLPSSLPPLSPSLMSSLSPTDPLDSYLKGRPSTKKKTLPSLDNSSLSQTSFASNSMLSSTADGRFRSSSRSHLQSQRHSQSAGSLSSSLADSHTNSHSKQKQKHTRIAESDDDDPYGQDEFADMSSLGCVVESDAEGERGRDGEEGDDVASVCSSRDPSVFEAAQEDLFLLASRPFALPFESKSCMVQVFSSREYDENLRLRVLNSGLTHEVLAERLVPIDKAYEIINANGHTNQLVHSTDNDDLQSLSTLLINMFKEADQDGSGECDFGFAVILFYFSYLFVFTHTHRVAHVR